jgi:hypothetical protein
VGRGLLRLRAAAEILGWRLAWVGPLWVLRPRYLVLLRDLTAPVPPAPPRADLRWSVLGPADVGRLTAMDPELGPGDVRRRLDEGQECHLCWAGDALVHYRWEASRPAYLPYLGLTFRPLAGDVCSTWSFTHPAYRGRGLLTVTSAARLHDMRAHGFRRAISVVAWWHSASLRVTRDYAGRTVVGAVGRYNLGPSRRPFAEGAVCLDGAGGFHVAEVDSARLPLGTHPATGTAARAPEVGGPRRGATCAGGDRGRPGRRPRGG